MRTALNQNLQGLKRAQDQVNLASSRIARWGFGGDVEETSALATGRAQPAEGAGAATPNADTMRFDGAERPRDALRRGWGEGAGSSRDGLSAQIDLSEEAIRLKAGEWAFRANIAATRSVLELERSLLELDPS